MRVERVPSRLYKVSQYQYEDLLLKGIQYVQSMGRSPLKLTDDDEQRHHRRVVDKGSGVPDIRLELPSMDYCKYKVRTFNRSPHLSLRPPSWARVVVEGAGRRPQRTRRGRRERQKREDIVLRAGFKKKKKFFEVKNEETERRRKQKDVLWEQWMDGCQGYKRRPPAKAQK